jgi:chemotaxis protein methyltransferase CheR
MSSTLTESSEQASSSAYDQALQAQSIEFKDADFQWLRKRASEHSGIVLPDSKRSMIYSRLKRRLTALGLSGFSEYRKLLSDANGPEFVEFINALTTNLTAFFREAHHFQHLRDVVMPELQRKRTAGTILRFWSAGCSTGEEPYSIAMTVAAAASAAAGAQAGPAPFEIVASDLDTKVLARASEGVYPMDRLEPIPVALRKRYLLRGSGGFEGSFRVRDELRAHLHFVQINLITNWQHPSPLQVIFCRNVVIYFDKATQRILFDRMADHLVPGGYLYLGHSETLFQISDRFEACGKTVFRRIR